MWSLTLNTMSDTQENPSVSALFVKNTFSCPKMCQNRSDWIARLLFTPFKALEAAEPAKESQLFLPFSAQTKESLTQNSQTLASN